MKYVNLYTLTEYSMLSSTLRIDDLISKAKANNYSALAITDYNNMHGAIKFYTKCLANQIKPIIGLCLTVLLNDKPFDILLYAKGNVGYQNLLQLATSSKLANMKLPINVIDDFSDLIVVVPYHDGLDNVISAIKTLCSKFNNPLYLGVDNVQLNDYQQIKSYNLPLVLAHKTAFTNKDDYEAYLVLKGIGQNGMAYVGDYFEKYAYLLSSNELLSVEEELISNAEKIARNCNLEIEFDKYRMPLYSSSVDTKQYLSELAIMGLKKRLSKSEQKLEKSKVYIARLEHELTIIKKMGFCDYFLIVYDFIRYAKKNNILVGPGRGSAPGSLVAYSLGITEIDPIEHDLLFERFLNPERVSMPDIDTDFPDNRRDEVIKYMGQKYGKPRVAHISTFGTFGPRLAIRDVARVLKVSDVYLDEIISCVDSRIPSINDALKQSAKLGRLVQNDELVNKVVRIVSKLEGLPRHISTHAAGIIMADCELVKYTALQEGINGLYQTQFEAGDLERLGLVKIDFLGLRNLTIIDEVISKIGSSFNINNIPLDDDATYKAIANKDTDGIFQLESDGMRDTLKSLKTSEFNDIVNAIALYRPGPMEMIPTFIKRKFKQEKVEYVHPDIADILKPTYGIIVFQEQILLIAQKIAGYSLGEADILRRAVSKKKSEILIKERKKFVSRALENGYSNAIANQIYDYIDRFANYGFNKSHSVAYSMIAYQMAYLKTHYYRHFMGVLMANSIGSIRLIKRYIFDCNKRNVQVLLPSVNYSSGRFESNEKGIYYSLLGIANVGGVTIDSFLTERNTNGKYLDYDSFIARTKKILSRRTVESLIAAGACDEFGLTRKAMIEGYEKSLQLSEYGSMFKDELIKQEYTTEEYSIDEASALEREALGFNLKYDIFKMFIPVKLKYKTTDLKDVKSGRVNVLANINSYREITTKKGDLMAFLDISDDTDNIDAVMFPEVYKTYREQILGRGIVLAQGKVEKRNDSLQLVIDKIRSLTIDK